MKAFTNLLIAAFAAFTLPVSALAATFTLNPTIDAFVSANNPGNNYGATGALAVSSASLSKGEFDSVIMFNFAAAKASFDTTFGAGQWAISSITLQLTASPPNNSLFNGSGATPANSAGNFSATWMQNKSWTEGNGSPTQASTTGGITFSTLSTYLTPGSDQSLGTAFAFGGATSGNTTWTLGLASSLVTDAAAGNQTSLLLIPTSGDTTLGMVVNSENFGTVANRPLLTVNASPVPEPRTTALLAGTAFLWIARRRHHARTE